MHLLGSGPQQFGLFAAEETPVPQKPNPHAGVNMAALHDLAILYTATEAGNNSGIRFLMTVDDAMKWCELPISSGILHGTRWAYFWTRVSSFITCYWLNEKPCIDLHGSADDGSWDKRIADAGCTKISLWEFSRVLNPLGVQVINEPSRIINEIMAAQNVKQAA